MRREDARTYLSALRSIAYVCSRSQSEVVEEFFTVGLICVVRYVGRLIDIGRMCGGAAMRFYEDIITRKALLKF